MSRKHAELCYDDGQLHVQRLPTGRNPIFFGGKQVDSFTVRSGEHFVIGETRFSLATDQATVTQEPRVPLDEQSFSANALRNIRFRDADQRLEVLSRLPEIISGAGSDNELFVRLVNMVLTGIPRASAAALVMTDFPAREDSPVHVLHWDRRVNATGDFQPSRRLILEAVSRQESLLHVWSQEQESKSLVFTASDNLDWAFCTPVTGPACAGWGIYVAGRFAVSSPKQLIQTGTNDLREELKFTEIVAATLSSLRHVRQLQRQQATLSQFFPPAVVAALESQSGDDVLRPRETEVSVLFCDLRGFSQKAEEGSADLLQLLNRVSKALGVMTHHILDQGGVIGDFQGDAAMGFWGWPLPNPEAVQSACLAAVAIRQEFEAAALRPGHPLAAFRAGIGLATGRAVAGGIGTSEHLKVTVFGPVVNLAARLEGMTKMIRAPILVDETTAQIVRDKLPPEAARIRRVATVIPYGMRTPVTISELLPPGELSADDVSHYEQALQAFEAGDWPKARDLLHHCQQTDRVKDFVMRIILEHDYQPPEDWRGMIKLESKR